MDISASMVKELREKTGAGVMDCKTALKESNGDISKAFDYLRKKGIATAQKRGGRITSEGQVGSYTDLEKQVKQKAPEKFKNLFDSDHVPNTAFLKKAQATRTKSAKSPRRSG